MTYEATRNAISSPASRGGATPSASPAGPMNNPSGPAPVPVSRFRARDSGRAMPTSDTSGPLFTTLSPSAALQSSLGSRLRARMDVNGSPEYALTWSTWDMPAGPPICRLRASARPTSASGFSGWPTPRSCSAMGAELTPEAMAKAGERFPNLETIVARVGWPTPTAGDGAKLDATRPVIERRLAAGKQVGVAGAVRVFGATPSGSPERTASPGALDPAFVSWLMGYPPEWLSCAPSAMPSSRKSRRSS